MTLKPYKKNWLLSLGLMVLILGFLAFFISQAYSLTESVQPASFIFKIPFGILIIVAIIVAPFLEEIIFRGFFTNNKILKWFSIIAITALIVLSSHLVLKILLLAYIVLLVYHTLKKSNVSLNTLIVLNALIFSFAHLSNTHLSSIETSIAPLCIRFSVGLILIWICINFSIIKSMLFHALWNFVPLLFMSYALFFPNTEIKHFENNALTASWNRVSKSSSNVRIYPAGNENAIISESSEALFLLKSLEWSKKDTINNYIPVEPYMSYKFNIILKDTINKSEGLHKKVKTFLIDSKLIKLK